MTQASIRTGQLYAWAGGSLLVSDAAGRCDDAFPLSGYYFHETRFLSRCVLTIDGQVPWLCESTIAGTDELDFTFTYPEVTAYGGGGSGQSGDEAPRDAAGLPQRGLEIL